MPEHIVRIKHATIRYDNGDILAVHSLEDGRYKWTLHKEESPPDAPRHWRVIATNSDVAGLHNALIGAAAIHHPARKGDGNND